MLAAWYSQQGAAADVFQTGEREMPQCAAGEVRVQVMCSGINPVDTKRRQGGRGAMASPLVVPHFDGAGVIEAVGEGVDASRIGERVWLYEAQWRSDFGTAAEYVTVPSQLAVPLPDNTRFAQGACLGIPALTAHRCVFADGSVQDQTVLVTGGAGAVGNYAVQFARLGGAQVITTVSGESKAALAREAGAAHTVNYRTEDVAKKVMALTDGQGVDRVVDVDFGGNLESTMEVIRPNGVVSTYASEGDHNPAIPFYQCLYKNMSVHFEIVFLMPEQDKRKAVADISGWLDQGVLRHQPGQQFALGDIVAAHQAVEAGASGKVMLRIASQGG